MRVLISSSVRQKKAILEQFLLSIYDLNLNGLKVDYAFVDDNDSESASNLLRNFCPLQSKVWLFEAKPDREPYVCDDKIHHWNNRLISRVANNKDLLLQHALKEQYDYILLLDSDLLLHPETILHLLSSRRDIISEIFWTRWNYTYELPNVWVRDEYTLYRSKRGEILAESEERKRITEFLKELQEPGIYKVGGLGACTLISRQALSEGVSFQDIYNISFQGEDRYFCIRAVSLGFELFADTYYPCYHIYRDKDLEGVPAFLRSIPYRSAIAFSKIAGHMLNDILNSSWDTAHNLKNGDLPADRYFTESGRLSFLGWLERKQEIFGEDEKKIKLIQAEKAVFAKDGCTATLPVKLHWHDSEQSLENSREETVELFLVQNIGWKIDGWQAKY